MVWYKALALWCAVLILAVLNGALRELILIPALGSFKAFIASGVILSGCIFLVALLGVPWYGRLPALQWLLVGVLWLCLTLVFEFGFGRLVQQKAWVELLQAYTFKGGNVWPLVLLVTLISPWLAASCRRLL
jgi:hypothetical protein